MGRWNNDFPTGKIPLKLEEELAHTAELLSVDITYAETWWQRVNVWFWSHVICKVVLTCNSQDRVT